MMFSVYLECFSRARLHPFTQLDFADHVRMSVKSSPSHTSLGMHHAVNLYKAPRFTSTRFADKYGRKTSFYLAWLWLVVVSGTS